MLPLDPRLRGDDWREVTGNAAALFPEDRTRQDHPFVQGEFGPWGKGVDSSPIRIDSCTTPSSSSSA